MKSMFASHIGIWSGTDPVRYPAELKSYVRTEFGDESPHWLVAESLGAHQGTPGRFRKRLFSWANALGSAARKLALSLL